MSRWALARQRPPCSSTYSRRTSSQTCSESIRGPSRSKITASVNGRTAAWRRSARPLLASLEQLVAQLLRFLGARFEALDRRERVKCGEPEQALEQGRRAVEDRPELRAAAFLQEPALLERRHRRVGVHAADPCDLRPRDGLQVRGD